MTSPIQIVSAAQMTTLVTNVEVVEILHDALVSGRVDPELDNPRLASPAPDGEFLLMPAVGDEHSGVKVLTVAPGNPGRGLPKIQGVYLLVGSDDLTPTVLLDGPELTLLRTPAVTVLAIRELLAAGARTPTTPLPVVVLGTGLQARRHLQLLHDVVGPVDAAVIGRRAEAVEEFVESFADGPAVRAGTHADLGDAEVIMCATSSTSPLFDDGHVRSDAVVAAVGAHHPDHAELPAELVRRADVVVEGRGAAMRESGNLLLARSRDEWTSAPPANLADLVAGRVVRRPGHPAVYSGVGMGWEDLAVAAALSRRVAADPSAT